MTEEWHRIIDGQGHLSSKGKYILNGQKLFTRVTNR